MQQRVFNFLKALKRLNQGQLLIVLLLLWLLLNLIQAALTGVIYDESYYFHYSRNLDWGYYDHPPVVALMVRLSSLLFDGGLSVRFVTVVLQVFTIALIWKTADDQLVHNNNLIRFFAIASSIVMFVVYGFITTPDSPLLFFTALLLYAYKRFLANDSWGNSLLLSLSMAGLVYSKYHGGLVILLLICSNPRLLLNYKFWISGITALLLYLPHMIWQFENGLPSFKYHTTGRSRPFRFRYFIEYLPGQALSFNPFIFFITLWILFIKKPKDLLFRSFHYIIAGMILFFWISTLRGHAQPQWTIAASVPMIILVYYHTCRDAKLNGYLRKFVYPTIPMLLILRVIISINNLPLQLEFFNKEQWARDLSKIADDRVLVFRDGYQKPSLYSFYTGKEATVINSVNYRKTQHDLHSYNQKFVGKKAAIVTDSIDQKAIPFTLSSKETIYIRFTDSLVIGSGIVINIFDFPKKIVRDSLYSLSAKVVNNGVGRFCFVNTNEPLSFHFVVKNKGLRLSLIAISHNTPCNLDPGESYQTSFSFKIPSDFPKGKAKCRISLKVPPFGEGYNGEQKIVLID